MYILYRYRIVIHLKSQNFSGSLAGSRVTWFLEYVFPLEFASQTSYPASDNINAENGAKDQK